MVDITRVAVAVDSRQVRSAKTELVGMQAAGMGAQKSMVALGAAVVGIGTAAIGLSAGVRVIADFDTALRGLQAVSGATASQMQQLEEQARSLGAATAFSASQAADAQQFLAMAGFDVNEILGATPGILQLAIAGNIDLARAADLASNVLGGFRLEVDQLNRVNNVLAATAANSNTSVEQLGSALSFAAPIAAAAGISIEETAAAIGALGDAGLQGTRAGTGFLGIIRQLSLITPKAESALSRYGISVEEVNVETRGLSAVLETLRQANLSAADAIQIFGSEAGPAGQILANSAERVREFTAELGNSEGAIDRMAEIMGQGLAMAFNEFQSAAEEAVLVVARDLGAGGQLEAGVRTATDGVRLLSENMDTLADVATGVSIIVGGRLAASAATAAASYATMAASGSSAIIGLRMMATVSPLTAVGLGSVAVAARGASAALALLGGPAGATITALAGAYFLLSDRQTLAEEAADKHREAIGKLDDVMGKQNETAKTAEQLAKDTARARLEDAKAANEQALAIVQAQMMQLREQRGLLERSSPGSPLIEGLNREMTQLSFEVVRAKEAVDDLDQSIQDLNTTPINIGGGSSGEETSRGLSTVTDKIQEVIDALNFESEQLTRTNREQAIYNALKQAGITASNDNAKAVMDAAGNYYDLEQAIKEADQAQKDYNETLKAQQEGRLELFELVEGLKRQREQVGMLAAEIEKLEAVRKAESIAAKSGIALSEDTKRQIESEIDARHALQKEYENEKRQLEELKQIGERSFDGMADALADFAMTGKLDFSSLTNSIIKDMIRIQIQQMALAATGTSSGSGFFGALASGFMGLFGGTTSPATGASLGGLSGGGFAIGQMANGGNPQPGSITEVNERGPEVLSVGNRQFLMMGNQSGKVTPNHMLGGAANVNIQIVNNGTPQEVTSQQQTQTADGGIDIRMIVDDVSSSNTADRASKTNAAFRNTFGAKERLVGR